MPKEVCASSAIIADMILITGGTGFIGSRVILRLVQSNIPLKVLLHPRKNITKLPHSLTLNAVVSSLKDRRSLRAVLSGVTTILHFASAENEKPIPNFADMDVEGSETLIKAAEDAKVKNMFYISRIGADVNSSYPLFRAKAFTEQTLQRSTLNYTILRVTDVFGAGDHLTRELANYISAAPGFIPLPESGESVLQPLWIEDLVSIILLIIEDSAFRNKLIEIGGGEYLTLKEILKLIRIKIEKRKPFLSISPAYLRLYNLWFKQSRKGFPLSSHWLDLFAINRTCALDSVPRMFKLLPARFQNHLTHLVEKG